MAVEQCKPGSTQTPAGVPAPARPLRFTQDGGLLLSARDLLTLQETYTEVDNALTKARVIVNTLMSETEDVPPESLQACAWVVFDFVHDARELIRKRSELFG